MKLVKYSLIALMALSLNQIAFASEERPEKEYFEKGDKTDRSITHRMQTPIGNERVLSTAIRELKNARKKRMLKDEVSEIKKSLDSVPLFDDEKDNFSLEDFLAHGKQQFHLKSLKPIDEKHRTSDERE